MSTQKIAHFTFHGRIQFFLSRHQQDQPIEQTFDWRGTIKDMVEAIAPPHPEIDLIVVNGQSVDWDYIMQDGDEVHVYSDFDAVDVPNKIRLTPAYPGKPKFILDTHLGRLASYLRMMGFDTLYRNDYPDDVLAEVSANEERIVLTRDVGVLKRGIVVYGYFVRNTDPRKRLLEINERYNLVKYAEPFGRCMSCNGNLREVAKATIIDDVPESVAETYDTFHQCLSCEKIYWKGSHYTKMERIIDEVMSS
ncbi:MAG: Mut7-C RNAse domain-containing protein [Chloroflexota bacterium]